MEEDNLRMIEEMSGVKILACVHDGEQNLSIDTETLLRIYK
jgi:hypothetical protein